MSDTIADHGKVVPAAGSRGRRRGCSWRRPTRPPTSTRPPAEAVQRLPIIPGRAAAGEPARHDQPAGRAALAPGPLPRHAVAAVPARLRLARGARRRAALTGSVLRWWHWTDGWVLESQAVAAGRSGHHEAMRAHTEGKKTRAARGRIVAVCAGPALSSPSSWPCCSRRGGGSALLALAVVAALATAGPPGRPPA